ncbi:hypothetical protein HME01_06910 [Vreelandella aquamarina]|nr:hypothetical protein HME01_06910 [Halomonas meridiana]
MIIHGGFIQAATRRLRGCLIRSLLSLIRYAALRGGQTLVARGKRGAPATHSARSADGGTQV